MKKNKSAIIIGIFLTIIFLIIFGTQIYQVYPNGQNMQAVVKTKDQTIGLEQTGFGQFVFRLDKDNRVISYRNIQQDDMLKNYEALYMYVYNDIIYLMLRDIYDNDTYAVAEYNVDFTAVNLYLCRQFPVEKIGGMSIADNTVYVTGIANNRRTATVYKMELPNEEKIKTEILYEPNYEAVTQITTDNNRRIINANYVDGHIVYCQDIDTIEQINRIQGYTTDYDFNEYVIALSLVKDRLIMLCIIAIHAVAYAILLYHLLFKTRSYGIVRFAVAVTVLTAMTLCSVLIGHIAITVSGQDDRLTSADYMLSPLMDSLSSYTDYDSSNSGFYEGYGYHRTFDTLNEFATTKTMAVFFGNIFIASEQGDVFTIDVSLDSPQGYPVNSIYSEELTNQLRNAQIQTTDVSSIISVKGIKYGVVVKVWDNEIQPKHFLTALIPLKNLESDIEQYKKKATIASVIVLIIGAIAMGIVTYFESRDLRQFSRVMERISQGRQLEFEKPKVDNWDLDAMWNSLFELFKDREKIFYSRNRIFKSYYRFAPRNIEKLLGKETIAEVNAGDMSRVLATVGMINHSVCGNINQEEYINMVNSNFSIISEHQIKYDGVLISNEANLSSMQILFTEGMMQAVRFGIDAIKNLEEKGNYARQKISIFMHHTDLYYGVAGSFEQTFPFILSAEIEGLKSFGEEFRDRGVRFVITGEAESQIEDSVERRYIGYLDLVNLNKRFKCYEVLDAYPVKEKKLRKMTDANFQKGLELFYGRNFYLARNEFAEVLKTCAEDQIAVWYLFKCEQLFNESSGFEGEKDISFGLFSDIRG